MSDELSTPVQLAADVVMHLRVQITPPLVVGPTGQGRLQVIPIVGGKVWGPLLNGTVARVAPTGIRPALTACRTCSPSTC